MVGMARGTASLIIGNRPVRRGHHVRLECLASRDCRSETPGLGRLAGPDGEYDGDWMAAGLGYVLDAQAGADKGLEQLG
jgi:hypothetical protein